MAYQYLPSDLAQLQTQEDENQRRLRQAQILQQAGFNPVQGGNPMLSLITALGSTLAGKRLEAKAGDKASELLAKRFEVENQAQQAKMEAEQRKRDEDFQRELQKIDFGNRSKAQYSQRNIDPLSPEGIAAQLGLKKAEIGMQPKGGPATEKGWQVMDTPQGLMRVNTLTGAVEPLKVGDQPLIGKAGVQPEKPKEIDPKIAAAAQAREILDRLEGNIKSGKTWTGPIDKFLPGEGQQQFESDIAQLVNPFQTLTRIPGQGSQSDVELQQLMKSFPSLGYREGVNQQSIANLRSYLDKIQAQQDAGAVPQGAPQAAPPQGQPTQTATNPQTGERIGLINGQWVPI